MTQALWITAAGQAELRDTGVVVRDGDLEIETLFSGISRGTERLVFHGHVPQSAHETMRAPYQEGSFSFPVKYGYSAVGRVKNGHRAGEVVFALFPHQSRFALPEDAVHTVPEDVPARRAILAANMETALNILWDAQISLGDRAVVVGCGVVGALTGYLAARIPGAEVTLVDIDPTRAALAGALGCAFARPEAAPGDADVVIHASASDAGLETALRLAGLEARVIEASWYGTHSTRVALGGSFHQRRLQIIGSQVGRVPARRSARWSARRRLGMALGLLCDPKLEALISGSSDFAALAADYATVLANPGTLCHEVRYRAQAED